MKIGIAIYREEVAGRIDLANKLKVFEIGEGKVLYERELELPKINLLAYTNAILSSKVEVFICGAINCFAFRMLSGNGVQVMPWVTGAVDDVLKNFLDRKLRTSVPDFPALAMGRGMGSRRRGGFGRCAKGRRFGGGRFF